MAIVLVVAKAKKNDISCFCKWLLIKITENKWTWQPHNFFYLQLELHVLLAYESFVFGY